MPNLSKYLPDPPLDTNNTQVHVNMNNEVMAKLRALTKKHGVKNAQLVRGLIEKEYELTFKKG